MLLEYYITYICFYDTRVVLSCELVGLHALQGSAYVNGNTSLTDGGRLGLFRRHTYSYS